MRTISRKFLLCAPFAVVVLLCGCLLGLAGCQSGPSAEELITQDLEEQLGAVRDTDSELYAEFVEDLEASNGEDLDMLGVDATDYVHGHGRRDHYLQVAVPRDGGFRRGG